jgi:hypothetical protein
MEKEFDFSAFGKVNPYKVPDGFFDELPQQTLALAKRRAASHKRITLITVTSVSVAASVALFVAWPFLTNQTLPTNNTLASNQTPFPIVTAVDSSQVTSVKAPKDSAKVEPKTEPTPVVKSNSSPVASPKKENLDAILAELSTDELMQMADTGDDDNFIND